MEALKLVIVTDEDGNIEVIPWDEPGELIIIESPRPAITRRPWDGDENAPRDETPMPPKRVH